MAKKTQPLVAKGTSSLDPAQDDPPPKTPQQNAQDSRDAGQYVLTPGVRSPVSSQNPESPPPERSTYEDRAERRDERRLKVEFIALLVGFVGLIGLGYTLSETRRQANIAERSLQVTQSPYISLGKADGIIAEYVLPPEGATKGAMYLFIQNTGNAPALSFLANVHSDLTPGPVFFEHIQRWRNLDKKGRIVAWPISERPTVGANSVYVIVVDPQWIPRIDEWEVIKADKWDGGFSLSGNFEYCDQWGKLHCEMFHVHYKPLPIGRFIANTYQCFIGFPFLLKQSDLGATEEYPVKILPPCEQPGERQREQEEYYKEYPE
jgi:hypothetical protein